MTKKEFFKVYMSVVIPLMLQGMITKMVSMIDNLMVGQLGDNAISSVAMGNKILDIIMFTIMGVAASSSIFIAQYYGAKNKQKQQEVFRIALLLVTSLLVVSFVALKLFPHHIVQFFIQDNTIQQQALSYIDIMLIGYIPFTYAITYSSALKVIGQVKIPLLASVVGVITNSTINYILIFGHFGFEKMGIQGAAIATVISRFVEFSIIYIFSKMYHFDFNTRIIDLFKVSKTLVYDVVKKAFPLAINEIIWSFGQATLLKFYGVRGSHAIAALSISDTTSSIFFAINQGISAATPVLVSQKLGSNEFDVAYSNAKRMLKMAVVIAIIFGIGMWGMSQVVPYLYQVSPQSFELSQQMIKIVGTFFWIYFVNTQCYFIMRAGGDMVSTLIMDGIFTWCFTIPVVALSVYTTTFSILIVYSIGQVCELVKMGVSLRFFFKKKWLKNITVQRTS